METRDLWERNSLLAEAFCVSDDTVRQAQKVLDEAQADRTRMLAAFAVTVGSDSGVADLMGLGEREVRLARRTVGKEDARSLAKRLLAHEAQAPAEPGPEPVADPQEMPTAPQVEVQLPHPRTEEVFPDPVAGPASVQGTPPESVVWSPAMDSVLLWSWQSGLDLQTVAVELGLSSRELLLRAQTLAAEGRLTTKSTMCDDPGQLGRHRRDGLQVPVPDSPEGLYSTFPYG
ncbi:hypothetical protein N566_17235 [Streptomycetaceae bacterium MP113-05]|nr:hypothetical protein N566_17235 [Streptomycetaceae bacterium MP113-05]